MIWNWIRNKTELFSDLMDFIAENDNSGQKDINLNIQELK